MTDLILSGRSMGGRHVLVDVAIDVDAQDARRWVLSAEQAITVALVWHNAPGYANADRTFTYTADNTISFTEILGDGASESRWSSHSVRDVVQFTTAELPLDVEVHPALDWLTPKCLVCRQSGHIAVTRAEAVLLHEGRPVQDVLPDVPGALRDQMLSGTHPECWAEILTRV